MSTKEKIPYNTIESLELYMVVHMEDYQLVDQWVFYRKEDAEAKNKELSRLLFDDNFRAAQEEGKFSGGDTFMDYQDSESWRDDDSRTTVHTRAVGIEGALE